MVLKSMQGYALITFLKLVHIFSPGLFGPLR